MTAIAKTRKGTAQRYAELLAAALPKPIETEAENERALEIVNHLMSKGQKKLAPEKRWLLRMLVREEPGRGVEDGERKGSRPTSSAHRWNQTVFSQWPGGGSFIGFWLLCQLQPAPMSTTQGILRPKGTGGCRICTVPLSGTSLRRRFPIGRDAQEIPPAPAVVTRVQPAAAEAIQDLSDRARDTLMQSDQVSDAHAGRGTCYSTHHLGVGSQCDHEILRRGRTEILDAVLVVGSDKGDATGPQLCGASSHCQLHSTFPEQEHLLVLVPVRRVGHAARSEFGGVRFELVTVVGRAFQDRPESVSVTRFYRQVFEPNDFRGEWFLLGSLSPCRHECRQDQAQIPS